MSWLSQRKPGVLARVDYLLAQLKPAPETRCPAARALDPYQQQDLSSRGILQNVTAC